MSNEENSLRQRNHKINEGEKINVIKDDIETVVEPPNDRDQEKDRKADAKHANLVKQRQSRFGPLISTTNQKVYTRVITIVSVFIIAWFFAKNETILARKAEDVERRFHAINCSDSFLKEIEAYPCCKPKWCGRFVSDRIIARNQLDELLDIAQRVYHPDNNVNNVSVFNFHKGYRIESHNKDAWPKAKDESNWLGEKSFVTYGTSKLKIQVKLTKYFNLCRSVIQLAAPTFIAKFETGTEEIKSGYIDSYWSAHVTKDVHPTFQYTAFLFLSNYGTDFTGGRLIFTTPSNVVVEPKVGRVVVFTAGDENPFYFEPIKNGESVMIVMGFTGEEKHIVQSPNFKGAM